MKISSAVVNGSVGTIGLALIRCLVNRGARVYAIAFPGDPRIERIAPEAAVIPCDMKELKRIEEQITEPVDAFFDLAWAGAIGPGRDDMLLQTTNIRCAVESCYIAKDLGCKVFVGVGSQAEHGRIEGKVTADAPCFPLTGYGMAKLCAGQMTRTVCKQLGIRHEWARVLSVFGADDGPLNVTAMIIDTLLRGEKPSLTPAEQLWDYIYADDAAEALCRMAEDGKDGKIYPLGSGEVRPLREYFEILRDEVDPDLPLGFGEKPYPPGQVMHLQADISELTKDTGFTPKMSFEEAARIVVSTRRERQQGESK